VKTLGNRQQQKGKKKCASPKSYSNAIGNKPVKAELRTSSGKLLRYKLVQFTDDGQSIFALSDITAGSYYLSRARWER